MLLMCSIISSFLVPGKCQRMKGMRKTASVFFNNLGRRSGYQTHTHMHCSYIKSRLLWYGWSMFRIECFYILKTTFARIQSKIQYRTITIINERCCVCFTLFVYICCNLMLHKNKERKRQTDRQSEREKARKSWNTKDIWSYPNFIYYA